MGTSFATRHCRNRATRLKKATPAQRVFCCYLESLGFAYRQQQGFFQPYYRIVDFYLPDHHLIIEIDGPYHDAEEDRRRDEWFTKVRGIPILRLTNKQVMSGESTIRVRYLYDGTAKRAETAHLSFLVFNKLRVFNTTRYSDSH